MPDSLPPVAKTSSDSELRPSKGSEPGTVDSSLNEAPHGDLVYAFLQSHKLLKYESELLNMHDGGQRMIHAKAEDWFRRIISVRDGQPGKR